MLHEVVLTLMVSSLLLWRPCNPVYTHDTESRLTRMITRMGLELVKDAQMKITATQFYRDQYYKSFEYQLAEMVFHVRDKFKKIIILYQLTNQNISQGRLYHRENLHTLTRIQQKGTEIDNLILMIEEWLIRKEKKTAIHERMKVIVRSGNRLDDTKVRAALLRASAVERRPSDYRVPRPRNASARRRPTGRWEYVPTDDNF